MTRNGSRLFWRVPTTERPAASVSKTLPEPRRGRRRETAAVMLLLAYVLVMTVAAGPSLRYTMAAGEQLLQPGDYIQASRMEPSP